MRRLKIEDLRLTVDDGPWTMMIVVRLHHLMRGLVNFGVMDKPIDFSIRPGIKAVNRNSV